MREYKAKIKAKKKRRLNIKRVFLLVLIIALVVLGVKYAFELKVREVIVVGNENVLENKIISLASLKGSASFLKVNEKNVCDRVLSDPLIKTCNLSKKIDLKIVITVSENYPLFYYNETHTLILSNGKEYDTINTFGVPNLINYVPEKVISLFVAGLNDISRDIIQNISEIEYAPSLNSDGNYIDEERFMLSMRDGNIVYVNINNISILNTYNKIYASNGGKKGYYNLDSDYGIYYFKEFESK